MVIFPIGEVSKVRVVNYRVSTHTVANQERFSQICSFKRIATSIIRLWHIGIKVYSHLQRMAA